jgi:tetratricopeptide (TPR) repeat protein
MRYSVSSLLIICISSVTFAHDVGDSVVVVADQKAELKAGDKVVGTVGRGSILRVDNVNGDWLWVISEGKKGWIHSRNVIESDKAIKFFTDAILENPNASMEHYLRARLWVEKEDFDKAITDYSIAIRLDPSNLNAYFSRSYTWGEKGEYDKAIADISHVIRFASKHAPAYYNRGGHFLEKTGYDKALADFNEAIRIDPRSFGAYNNLSFLYATCPDDKYRDGKKAVEYGLKACEVTDWKNDHAVDTLSSAYAENGDFESAIKWLEKAVEMNPTNVVDSRKKKMALFKAGKPYRFQPGK